MVEGSIPDAVIGNFHHLNPSGLIMVLSSTQTLNRNKYQKYLLGVKAAGALGSHPFHLHVPIV
jgi:predicted membrane-bound spermidine synthase